MEEGQLGEVFLKSLSGGHRFTTDHFFRIERYFWTSKIPHSNVSCGHEFFLRMLGRILEK